MWRKERGSEEQGVCCVFFAKNHPDALSQAPELKYGSVTVKMD